jgi:hypothetical protein
MPAMSMCSTAAAVNWKGASGKVCFGGEGHLKPMEEKGRTF